MSAWLRSWENESRCSLGYEHASFESAFTDGPSRRHPGGTWIPAYYPFRYVLLWHPKEWVVKFRNPMVDTVLTAVEALEAQGWELVNVDQAVSLACMRRTQP